MTLSSSDINLSAIMAVMLTKEQSREELQEILDQTANEELLKTFGVNLRAQLAQIVNKPIEEFAKEFISELVGRIRSNAKYKLTL